MYVLFMDLFQISSVKNKLLRKSFSKIRIKYVFVSNYILNLDDFIKL